MTNKPTKSHDKNSMNDLYGDSIPKTMNFD